MNEAKKRKARMSEAELAKHVVSWLKADDWEVYQEVSTGYGGARADIVATRGPVIWVIETKTSLGLAVLDQACRWPVHLRSVGVPQGKEGRSGYGQGALPKICSALAVGVLEADSGGYVREAVRAPFQRISKTRSDSFREILHPEQKVMAEAGTKGGGYFTEYRRTMIKVRKFVRDNPGCTIKQIMGAITEHHYSSDATFRSTCVQMLQSAAEQWCRTDRSLRPYRFFDDHAGEEIRGL